MSATQRYKIVLLGEGRVGKTSILLRYIRGEYTDQQTSTIQPAQLQCKTNRKGTPMMYIATTNRISKKTPFFCFFENID